VGPPLCIPIQFQAFFFQVVNKYFSVFAGIISFWIPASIMVYVYAMVYKEMKRLQSSFKNGRVVSLHQNAPDHSEDNDLQNCHQNESLDIDRCDVVRFHKHSALSNNSDHICVPLHFHDTAAITPTAPPTPRASTSLPTMTISNQERESRSGKILTKLNCIC
jgi:hypothetical protein